MVFFLFSYQWFKKQPIPKDFQQNLLPTQHIVAIVSISRKTKNQQNHNFHFQINQKTV